VTVNVPESYITAINKLIGCDGLFPSRSELIRVAVREFLIKEITNATNAKRLIDSEEDLIEDKELDDQKIVKVPIETRDENNNPIRSFKTYKIIKRLD